jgi:hypothetical protein
MLVYVAITSIYTVLNSLWPREESDMDSCHTLWGFPTTYQIALMEGAKRTICSASTYPALES